jgi:c(7)-type cytochrome triheme protein
MQPRSAPGRVSMLLLLGAALVLLTAFGAAPDVVFLGPKHDSAPVPSARFSHVEHSGITCHQCHPKPYATPSERMTHAQMDRGLSCGACHDGGRAFAVRGTPCQRCHVK